jgi:acyl-coenzyme A thioesterase PaaI-like protein
MFDFNGSNFVGGKHENGFGLRFAVQSDGSLLANYTFDILKQGPPGIAHGGAVAAVLDEAMTAAVFAANLPSFTVNLNIDYRAPIRLGVPVRIMGRLDVVDRRKLYLVARITLPDGTVAAEAKALFLTTPDAVAKPPATE